VDLSNKRAVEAERRVQELFKDKTDLVDTQIPMLKVKLDRKKTKNQALCAKLVSTIGVYVRTQEGYAS